MNGIRRMGKVKILVAAAVGGLLLVATLAFTNTNTVDASKAGLGSGAISGYAISAVDYALDASDPSKFSSVSFKVGGDITGHSVYVKLVSAGTTWYGCTVGTYDVIGLKTPVSCTTNADVASADQLTVSVAQ